MNLLLIWTELKLALAALLIGLLLGFLSGRWAISISVALFLFIVWQLVQTARLREWLMLNAPTEQTPRLSGAADKIISQICAIKKENSRQQEKLEELLRRFDAATRAMPDAMLIVNEQQVIDWANPAAKKLLGIDSVLDIGQRIDNIVRDPEITNYLTTTDFAQPLEFSSARSAENDLMLRVINYGEGRKLLVVHDHQDLLRLQQVRKSFISNASHEMRTPLTVIIGYLEALLQRADAQGGLRQGIEGALDQSLRLKQLIEDLLSLSRLESLPLSKSKLTPVDITALIHESVKLAKASKLYNDQAIELRLQNDVFVQGDQRELHSAVQNIVDNAIKYSPAKTPIEIEWRSMNSGDSCLVIKDHGDGIDQTHIPRLTERFYRVDKGRARDKGGTGLGLSIVKHVMERHGGELLVASEPGVGTTVELHFPRDRISVSSQRASA